MKSAKIRGKSEWIHQPERPGWETRWKFKQDEESATTLAALWELSSEMLSARERKKTYYRLNKTIFWKGFDFLHEMFDF